MFPTENITVFLSRLSDLAVGLVARALVRQFQANEDMDMWLFALSPASGEFALDLRRKVNDRILFTLNPCLVILQANLITIQISPSLDWETVKRCGLVAFKPRWHDALYMQRSIHFSCYSRAAVCYSFIALRPPGRYRYRVEVATPSLLAASATVIFISVRSALAAARSSRDRPRGLPPKRPLARADASPAIVRSRMMERSNSANAPKI